MLFSQACRRPCYTRDTLLSLRSLRTATEDRVQSVIHGLQLHRPRRRGCRAGAHVQARRARTVKLKVAPAGDSEIPVVIGRRFIDDRKRDQPTVNRVRVTIRRHGNLDPLSAGVFNSRSIHNKYASIAHLITERQLNVVGLVETWHDSHECPDLIACTPPGYSYIDRPRPRLGPLAVNLHTNHGGVALLYRNDVHVREVSLPEYKSFEQVSAFLQFLQCAGFSTFVPGSRRL